MIGRVLPLRQRGGGDERRLLDAFVVDVNDGNTAAGLPYDITPNQTLFKLCSFFFYTDSRVEV